MDEQDIVRSLSLVRNQYFNRGENLRRGGSRGDSAIARRIRKV